LNLPDTQVSGLEVKGNELVIATHGRSFYILEGLSAIRQIADIRNHTTKLFAPARAVRRIIAGQIYYYLAEPVDKLSLEILDGSGHLVRKLVSSRSRSAGSHQATWNLRHGGSIGIPKMILESMDPRTGPLAVPGTYQVRMIADGKTQTVLLTIESDPRLSVPAAEYQSQLEFALEVRDAITTAHKTVIEIREVRDQINRRRDNLKGGAAKAAAEFVTRSSEIERQLYQVKNSSPKDKIAYPIQLNDRLAGLAGVVAHSDSAPTKAQRTVFAQLNETLQELVKRYETTKQVQLKIVNDELRQAGRPGIDASEHQ